MTAKKRYGMVIVLAILYTALYRTAHMTTKIKCDALMVLAKPHRKVWY